MNVNGGSIVSTGNFELRPGGAGNGGLITSGGGNFTNLATGAIRGDGTIAIPLTNQGGLIYATGGNGLTVSSFAANQGGGQASGYERLWLGLGAISFDLMLAMIVTSLVRGRLNRILWRAIHLLAYLCWPVAFAHSIGSSKDLQHGWLLDLSIACALIVVAAVRLAAGQRGPPAPAGGPGRRPPHPARPARLTAGPREDLTMTMAPVSDTAKDRERDSEPGGRRGSPDRQRRAAPPAAPGPGGAGRPARAPGAATAARRTGAARAASSRASSRPD